MIALQHAEFGEPADVVSPAERPVPEPGPGELRLRLVRSPIHNHDLATIRGVYGYKPALPAVGGSEMLGVVETRGSGAEAVAQGARVIAIARGAWAEHVIVPAQGAVPVPDAIDDDTAAQLLAMPLSAIVLLDDLRVEAGAWIVQNAASGAVGRIVMREGQRRGLNVINLVRRASAADELKAHGAKHVVVTDGEAWPQRVRELCGTAPVARVIDSVAGPESLLLQRLLGRHGEYIVFGGLAGAAMKLDPSLMISQEIVVRGFWMTAWLERASREQRAAAMKRVFELALQRELPLPVAAVYPLARAQEALAAAERPGRTGKILFAPTLP